MDRYEARAMELEVLQDVRFNEATPEEQKIFWKNPQEIATSKTINWYRRESRTYNETVEKVS